MNDSKVVWVKPGGDLTVTTLNEGIDLTPYIKTPTRRGTSNRNDRGSSYARRARRAWLLENYASNTPGFCRCYRCGLLLFNPDERPTVMPDIHPALYEPLTVDRIVPGCQGGTYRRNNIRPACGACNSETGGALAGRKS